uniref:Uncharacterized protein n=1 Tax=Anopheles christyi TaxID=43041 RepID=A0A182K2U5_9DIPT
MEGCVPIVTPVVGPRVLDQPVVFPVQLTVANRQHRMVQLIQLVLTLRLIVHTVRVEAERFVTRIDSDRQRTVLEQCHLECVRIARRHIDPAGNRCVQCHVLHVTVPILSEVTTILILHRYTANLHHPLVRAEVFPTVTPIVTIAPGTVDQCLLREAHELLRFAEVCTLDVSDRTERPAGTAHALILDRCYRTANTPIPAVGQIGQMFAHLVRERLATIVRAGRAESTQRLQLLLGTICQMVNGYSEPTVGPVVRVDEAQVLSEHVQTTFVLLFAFVRFAMLALEPTELIVQVLFRAGMHKLLHRVERGVVSIAGSGEANAWVIYGRQSY